MITNPVNTKLNLSSLEKELIAIQKKIHPNGDYFFREKYVDRGTYDPFYILRIKTEINAEGDDLLDEPLYATGLQFCQIKYLCRESNGLNQGYWKAITGSTLNKRINRFLDMFRYDYIQPPGTRSTLNGTKESHPQLKGKRYLYEISSPWKTITGIGPSGFTGMLTDGAIRGQITDLNGNPASNIEIELVMPNQTLTRKSEEGGLFWFAKIPKGTYRLRLPYYSGQIHLFYEPFGLVKGNVSMMDENNPASAVELEAPDGTIFNAKVEPSGDLKPIKLPAFHYKIRIPDHYFKNAIRLEGNTVISGLLKDPGGEPIPGATILILAKEVVLAKRISKPNGSFRFELSEQGPYKLKVPGYALYAKKASPSAIEGQVAEQEQPVLIELIANGNVISSQRTDSSGHFKFRGLTPGNYKIRTPGIHLRLDEQRELTGTITGILNDKNGPVQAQVIQLINTEQEVIATNTTDDLGKINFIDIPTGNYTLKAAGFIFQSSQTYSLFGHIKGVLINDDGAIKKHQRIAVYKNDKSITYGYTNSEGLFEFNELSPGDYTIRYSGYSLSLETKKESYG